MRGSTATISERSATDNARAAHAHTYARARTHIYTHTLCLFFFLSFSPYGRMDDGSSTSLPYVCYPATVPRRNGYMYITGTSPRDDDGT